MFAAFCSLCDNSTRFILNQLSSRSVFFPDRLLVGNSIALSRFWYLKQVIIVFFQLLIEVHKIERRWRYFRSGVPHPEETGPLLEWMVFIHCSELTGPAAHELIQSMFSKMSPVLVAGRNLNCIVSTLLDGVLAQQTASETNLLYVYSF